MSVLSTFTYLLTGVHNYHPAKHSSIYHPFQLNECVRGLYLAIASEGLIPCAAHTDYSQDSHE